MTEYPIIRPNRYPSVLYLIVVSAYIICFSWFIPDILHITLMVPRWQFVAFVTTLVILYIAVFYLTWPVEVNITQRGITLVYKRMNNKFISWENIEKIKMSRSKSKRVESSVQYNINGNVISVCGLKTSV